MELDYEQRIKNAFAEIITCAECGNNAKKFNAELTADECKLIRKVIKRKTGRDLTDFIRSRRANFRDDMDEKKYSMRDICKCFGELKGVHFPPSGKYYEFKNKNYSSCEDWDLPFRLEEILGGEE